MADPKDDDKKADDKKADDKAATTKRTRKRDDGERRERREPTPAEDEAARKKAERMGDEADEAKARGLSEHQAKLQREADREGISALGKDAVVVQDHMGNPVTARKNLPVGAQHNASGTNPALMANDPPEDTPPHGNTGQRVVG